MLTATVEEVQLHLPELLERLSQGQEVVITRAGKPVARLVTEELPKRQPRKAGNCKGMLAIVNDDDEHLADFAEYMA
jgi:prevent-host-death family protein